MKRFRNFTCFDEASETAIKKGDELENKYAIKKSNQHKDRKSKECEWIGNEDKKYNMD